MSEITEILTDLPKIKEDIQLEVNRLEGLKKDAGFYSALGSMLLLHAAELLLKAGLPVPHIQQLLRENTEVTCLGIDLMSLSEEEVN